MGQALRAQKLDYEVAWRPQPGPQTALLACPIFEVFYGGARGGGKTDGMLGDFATHAGRHGLAARGVFFRRRFKQLEDVLRRAYEIYGPLGAEYAKMDATWTFPGGAKLKLRHLWDEAAAEEYQGHSYSWLCFEEITNWPFPSPINKLRATLRSTEGVPVRFRATGNPGGAGHQWVKARYVDPAPLGYQPTRDPDSGEMRVFIPAKLEDNPALMVSDPAYERRLLESGSPELVRAWRHGDWDVVLGAYFDCWRADKHVVPPVELPAHWSRFRAFDWGSARPFCCLWIAVSDGTLTEFPRGALVVYREWYGCGEPNVGLKLTVEKVATGIAERERGEKMDTYLADPQIFVEDGGPSMASRMYDAAKLSWNPADNKRVPGWDQVRQRLVGEDDKPMLYVFSTCTHLIRTLPALQHDEHRPEDVDTDAEDHAGDALRYGCMSRPYVRDAPLTEEQKHEQWLAQRRRRRYSGEPRGRPSAWSA